MQPPDHITATITTLVGTLVPTPAGAPDGAAPDGAAPDGAATLAGLGVDSLRLVTLVGELEQVFGIRVADADLSLANFTTLADVACLVQRYLETPAVRVTAAAPALVSTVDVSGPAPAYADFPLEGQLLMHTAQLQMSAEDVRRSQEILRGNGERRLDWGRFADLAARHRVLNLVARSFAREQLELTDAVQYWTLRSSYLYNRQRNLSLMDELRVLLATLASRRVSAVVRKGTYLTAQVYPDPALRFMVDLDLYVPAAQAARFGEVMAELGYRQGNDTPNGRVIEELEREEAIFSALHEAAFPPYRRPTGDPYTELITIDASHNLMPPAARQSLPAADFLARARQVRLLGEPALVCSPADTLLDLGVHLYREATSVCSIEMGKDLCLIRFLDIIEWYRYCVAELDLDLDEVASLAQRYDLAAELYYALHFADVLYPGILDAGLLDRLRPADLSYLDEYGALEHLPGVWQVDFRKRLFDPDHGAGIAVPK